MDGSSIEQILTIKTQCAYTYHSKNSKYFNQH